MAPLKREKRGDEGSRRDGGGEETRGVCGRTLRDPQLYSTKERGLGEDIGGGVNASRTRKSGLENREKIAKTQKKLEMHRIN